MIKNASFRVRLNDVNLVSDDELVKLLDRIGNAIATIHSKLVFDSSVEVELVEPQQQVTMLGRAQIDGYMKVERAKGGPPEHYYNVNGESIPITPEQYDAAHAAPAKGAH